jgi:acetyl-CoA carboxylase carboxyl transferase subunit alpha
MNKLHLIDDIIKEPTGGAHSNPNEMFATVKKIIVKELSILSKVSDDERIKNRIDKFCAMGVVRE